MTNRYSAFAASVLLLCAVTTSTRADDASDIRTSGKAFAEAIRSGDVDTARKYAVTNEHSDAGLALLAEITKARANLVDAAVAKFGADGKTVVPGADPSRSAEVNRDFEDAKIQVNGDAATVSSNSGKPAKFKKVGGTWKLDLTELAEFEKMEQSAPTLHKVAASYVQSRDEIKQGKYATADEAKAGIRQNMMSALMSGRSRAGH